MSKSTFHQVPNMRGKRHIYFSCGCCEAQDLREKFMKNTLRKELIEDINEGGECWPMMRAIYCSRIELRPI